MPPPFPLFDETTRPCKNTHSLKYKLRRIQEFWLGGGGGSNLCTLLEQIILPFLTVTLVYLRVGGRFTPYSALVGMYR